MGDSESGEVKVVLGDEALKEKEETKEKISIGFDATEGRAYEGRRTNLETLDQLLPSHLSITQTPLSLVRDRLDSLEDGLDDLRLLCQTRSNSSDERFGVSSDSRISDQESNGGEAVEQKVGVSTLAP